MRWYGGLFVCSSCDLKPKTSGACSERQVPDAFLYSQMEFLIELLTICRIAGNSRNIIIPILRQQSLNETRVPFLRSCFTAFFSLLTCACLDTLHELRELEEMELHIVVQAVMRFGIVDALVNSFSSMYVASRCHRFYNSIISLPKSRNHRNLQSLAGYAGHPSPPPSPLAVRV